MFLTADKGVEIVDNSYHEMDLSDYLVVYAENGEIVSADKQGVYSSDIIWTSDNTNAISINGDTGLITSQKGSDTNPGDTSVTIKATSSDNSEVFGSVTMQALRLSLIVDGDNVTGGEKTISGLVWNGPYSMELKVTDNFLKSNRSNFSVTWSFSRDSISLSVGAIEIYDVNESNFTAMIDRDADAFDRTVYSSLILNGTRIALLHFTATPS